MNMLDFGCGCGDFAQYLGGSFNKIFAYDSSSEILKIAESRIDRDNIKIIPSLDLINEKLDLTISVTVLQHIIDNEELLSTIKAIGSKSKGSSYFICLETVKCPKYNLSQPSYLKERDTYDYVYDFEKSGYQIEDILSFYNPYFIPSKSLLAYKTKMKTNNVLYKLLRKAGVNSE
jgi:ubiquinone/menaquinone biosynthesis C-methylase UbiE